MRVIIFEFGSVYNLLKMYLGAPQLWLSIVNGSAEKKPLKLMTKHIQFPKPCFWEDPRWRTVNVESKRVCCGCVAV